MLFGNKENRVVICYMYDNCLKNDTKLHNHRAAKVKSILLTEHLFCVFFWMIHTLSEKLLNLRCTHIASTQKMA
jgi:hypothetical protein